MFTFRKTFLSLVVISAVAANAWAQSRYAVTVITQGKAYGINKQGDVCGSMNSATWSSIGFTYVKGQLTQLGVFKNISGNPYYPDMVVRAAYALNDFDQVVGFMMNSELTGGTDFLDSFLYQKGTAKVIATGSDDGGFTSIAFAINNAGIAVGSYDAGTYSAVARGYRYQNGQLFDLGTLGGPWSEAYGINKAGQIVGVATTVNAVPTNSGVEWDAFLYTNGKMQVIGGVNSNRFFAYAINDNGWIAGTLFNSLSDFESPPDSGPGPSANSIGFAALCVNGNVSSLGTLPGFASSVGVAINNRGDLVGDVSGPADPVTGLTGGAFIYTGGKMYNLNSLIKGSYFVIEVGDINDSGQIAATVIQAPFSATSQIYAARLDPVNK